MIRTQRHTLRTEGRDQMQDLTPLVEQAITASACRAGIVTVFVAHATAAVAISEFEPGLMHDIHATLDAIAPARPDYRHNTLNHDDNAHSHLRSTVIGPSLTIPFDDGILVLGTWQRVVLLDFDTHARSRTVVIQVIGE